MGTHSKKRPNNIILGRTFEFRMLDMIEFGIEKYRAISEFGGQNDYMVRIFFIVPVFSPFSNFAILCVLTTIAKQFAFCQCSCILAYNGI